jgi:spermidine synthase
MHGVSQDTWVLDQRVTSRGEFVLRQHGERVELIANGVFLVDTDGGTSERLLVDVALDGRPGGDVLIGGLGFGSSVAAALDAGARSVTVVEHEPVVVEWFARHLPDRAERTLGDPRVTVLVDDFAAVAIREGGRWDAICADVDNGPDLLARPGNASLYRRPWLEIAARRLRPGGRLTIWSADRSAPLERALSAVFGAVRRFDCPAPRGAPDVVYRVAVEA